MSPTRPDRRSTARNRRLVRILGMLRAGYSAAEMRHLFAINATELERDARMVTRHATTLVDLIGREDSCWFTDWLLEPTAVA